MTRVHDMGGRFGDGAVVPEPDGTPQFGAAWHGRALAVTLAAGALGQWSIDTSRHARECLSPKDYARFSYYEKWLAGLADLLVAKGMITQDELRAGHGNAASPLAARKLLAQNVAAVLAKGGPATRDSAVAPMFKVGDTVHCRRPARNVMVPGGHTRMPAYAEGATGRILRYHGTHILPDSNAHGLGEAAEPLYAVAFEAADLWGTPEGAEDDVVLDLWQSYLGPT